MKLLMGVAAAMLWITLPMAADAQQATSCGGFEAAPTLPDGATANRQAIERGNARYAAWSQARVARLQACKVEIETLQAQLRPMIAAFEPAKAELDAVVASWTAEVEEFNTRGRAAGARDDH